MRLFRNVKQIGIEILFLTLAVLVGIAVLGYLTRTGAFSTVETIPGVGWAARAGKALLYQTYNP